MVHDTSAVHEKYVEDLVVRIRLVGVSDRLGVVESLSKTMNGLYGAGSEDVQGAVVVPGLAALLFESWILSGVKPPLSPQVDQSLMMKRKDLVKVTVVVGVNEPNEPTNQVVNLDSVNAQSKVLTAAAVV